MAGEGHSYSQQVSGEGGGGRGREGGERVGVKIERGLDVWDQRFK